ncbi:TonB-dependent receptor [Sphingomonas aquatilis]
MTGSTAFTVSRSGARAMLRTSAWSALAFGLIAGTPALAQTAAPTAQAQPDAPKQDLDEKAPGDIVVVGTRASLQSAIQRKRNAGTVVDSIVADDIASFPDKNIGDSLARVTGVQLSREFGEGNQISIRGVEPDLNRVEINGVGQSSALGARAGDFREFASELVKSIDVYKGYQAKLTEGGLGGTVLIETRKPLELKKGIATVNFAEQHLETTDDWKPRATLLIGTPSFLIDGLGVLANITYSDVTTRQDYASNTGWSRIADFDRSDQKTVANDAYSSFTTYASCANVGATASQTFATRRAACENQFFDWAPNGPRYRNLVRHDKRLSGDVTLQYEFANNFRAYAEVQWNNRDQRLQDVNYALDMGRIQRYQLDNPVGSNTTPQIKAGTSTVDANHVVTSYTAALTSVPVSSTVISGSSNILGVQRRDFQYNQKSRYYITGFDWVFDRLRLKGLASRSESRTIGNTNLISISTGISGMQVDRRNDLGVPVFTYPSNVNPGDPAIYTDFSRLGNTAQAGPNVQYRPTDNGNTENQLKLDGIFDADFGPLKSIEFGGQFRWADYYGYNGGGSRLLTPASGSTPAVYQSSANVSLTTTITSAPTVAQRVNGTSYTLTQAEYANLINALGTATGGAPMFTGIQGIPSAIPNRLAYANFDPKVLALYYDLSGFNQGLVRQANGLPQIPAVKIDETIAAGYAQANLESSVFGMRLRGNAGVRYIFTKDVGTGTNVRRVTRFTATGGVETVTIGAQQLSLSTTYVDILPAFNASLEVTPNLVLTANWAKNLARPKPTDLVPNINCLDDQTIAATDDVCTAGNPALKPYRADQWEVNLSWYPNKDTLVSLGYYKKSESSFVIQNILRSGVDLFQDGVTYTVRQPANGFGALLDGVEASAQTAFTFLPKPFDGFGASANMTYARALRTNLTNLGTNQPLNDYPGLSKWTWNASIFYDKGWLNARLAYNYRSDWLQTVADSTNGNLPIYRKAEGYLDAKVTFRFPQWHYSLFMEMQNINKEYGQTYIKNIGTSEVFYPGQRFFAGASLKF